MSGLLLSCAPTAKISLTSSVLKTAIGIAAPANRIIKIQRVSFGFFGVSATDSPVECWMRVASNDGTATSMTTANFMCAKRRPASSTMQSTCKHTYTVEPTTIAGIIHATAVHPQSGHDSLVFDNLGIEIDGSDTYPLFTLRFLSSVNTSVLPTIWFEE